MTDWGLTQIGKKRRGLLSHEPCPSLSFCGCCCESSHCLLAAPTLPLPRQAVAIGLIGRLDGFHNGDLVALEVAVARYPHPSVIGHSENWVRLFVELTVANILQAIVTDTLATARLAQSEANHTVEAHSKLVRHAATITVEIAIAVGMHMAEHRMGGRQVSDLGPFGGLALIGRQP